MLSESLKLMVAIPVVLTMRGVLKVMCVVGDVYIRATNKPKPKKDWLDFTGVI
jgi:hypothetical protein